MKSKYTGFTLVELLVVLAIVSILASLAYSSYSSSVEKSRRRDAQGVLQGLAQAMERYQTTNGSYAGAADGSNQPTIYSKKSPVEGARKYYDLYIHSSTTTSYMLTAIPDASGGQAGDGLLSLSSTGRQGWAKGNDGADPSTLTSSDCWDC